MMKKALVLTSVASMIEQFNMQNIELLKGNDYDVTVITNFEHGSTMPLEKVKALRGKLENEKVNPIHVPIPRKIFDIKGIIDSYRTVKKECEDKKYDIIHCHSPIGGVIARLAARKCRKKFGTKVIYTAHGFHFFKGAPAVNWLIYYPIEKICSFFTDVLITINKEDFEFAKKHIHAKEVKYVPGVGLDIEKLKNVLIDRDEKRQELGIGKEQIAVLSVGELNDNKNHQIVIRAISGLKNNDIVYIICGKGEKEEYLKNLAEELKVNLIIAGYRNDVAEIYKSCDIFALPSKREGLSVALMESMAAGLPVVCSNIRGNVDLVEDGENGFLCGPTDEDAFAEKIMTLLKDEKLRESIGQENKEKVKSFSMEKVNETMYEIYGLM